jgi:Spy/CpxP family protein refolding chaperone
MRFEDHLSREQRQQLNKMRTKSTKRKPKRMQEHLSRRDLEELMGMNRQTYYKKNGAWHGK